MQEFHIISHLDWLQQLKLDIRFDDFREISSALFFVFLSFDRNAVGTDFAQTSSPNKISKTIIIKRRNTKKDKLIENICWIRDRDKERKIEVFIQENN